MRYPGLIYSVTTGQAFLSTTVGVGNGYSPGPGGNIWERIRGNRGGGVGVIRGSQRAIPPKFNQKDCIHKNARERA